MITPEERARWLTEARDSNEYFTPNIQRLIAALNALEESERQADRLAEELARNISCVGCSKINLACEHELMKKMNRAETLAHCKIQLLAWARKGVRNGHNQ